MATRTADSRRALCRATRNVDEMGHDPICCELYAEHDPPHLGMVRGVAVYWRDPERSRDAAITAPRPTETQQTRAERPPDAPKSPPPTEPERKDVAPEPVPEEPARRGPGRVIY